MSFSLHSSTVNFGGGRRSSSSGSNSSSSCSASVKSLIGRDVAERLAPALRSRNHSKLSAGSRSDRAGSSGSVEVGERVTLTGRRARGHADSLSLLVPGWEGGDGSRGSCRTSLDVRADGHKTHGLADPRRRVPQVNRCGSCRAGPRRVGERAKVAGPTVKRSGPSTVPRLGLELSSTADLDDRADGLGVAAGFSASSLLTFSSTRHGLRRRRGPGSRSPSSVRLAHHLGETWIFLGRRRRTRQDDVETRPGSSTAAAGRRAFQRRRRRRHGDWGAATAETPNFSLRDAEHAARTRHQHGHATLRWPSGMSSRDGGRRDWSPLLFLGQGGPGVVVSVVAGPPRGTGSSAGARGGLRGPEVRGRVGGGGFEVAGLGGPPARLRSAGAAVAGLGCRAEASVAARL